ncbi:hypothetical protein [Psychrobacter sp. 4Bb]|uniref:hypothetical protein n=1 Tax=Psychrobacter sp. 4Bb TaxID=888436 RepID=UPI000C79BBB1|nr:hypothetical protein [Psychrobacter sp. 4Bb]PKH81157.1 hypothetical protein CXF60_06230 [Psychrobacter sp. 4Bb]
MSDLEKTKTTRKKKPPTQTAGVNGINAHGGMGEAPHEPLQNYVNWQKLIGLPAFEMFVFEQSGQSAGATADEWVKNRRAAISDDMLYKQYAEWHKNKGLWAGESPAGDVI